MTHAMTLPQTTPFNWGRSSALSATMAFHLFVLLLLLSPPVVHTLAPVAKPDDIMVVFRDPEVLPPPVQPLDPPKPPKAKQKTPTPPKPQPVPEVHNDPVVMDAPSTMATPVQDAPPAPSGPSTDIAADTAPTPMAYGTRRAVPYPMASLRRGEQGKVVLKVLIGPDGAPQRIEIDQSSGFADLDRAARLAVMKWKFTPGTKNGVAYTAWALVPVEFQLDRR